MRNWGPFLRKNAVNGDLFAIQSGAYGKAGTGKWKRTWKMNKKILHMHAQTVLEYSVAKGPRVQCRAPYTKMSWAERNMP